MEVEDHNKVILMIIIAVTLHPSSSAPSTTTTSSLSRADSLSSLEYHHGSHPLHHSHSNRHLSGSISGSTTTGSTTGSSFGHSLASGSVSSGGSSSVYLQHSAGLGRANLNAAIHHQRNPNDSSGTSSRTGALGQGGDASSSDVTGQRNNTSANGRSASNTGSSAGAEQGRNSTKRAAQNRAAQRAFRQRKDLYVRELERKAELLQQAEGKILRLTARNRELEVALAANSQASNTPLSPQQSPLHSTASPTTGLVCAAGLSSSMGDQDHHHQQQPLQTLHHSSSGERLSRSDREHNSTERPSSVSSQDQELCDDSGNNQSGRSYPSSLSRATLGRRSVSQPMRSAYNASSPPLTNDSLRFHSLKQQLAENQQLNQSRHTQSHYQYQQHQQHLSRADSDYEFDHNPLSHRQLHRHPSEPSLNQSRRGSNSAGSGDDYTNSGEQNCYGFHDRPHNQHHDQNRSPAPRRSSTDSRMEVISPTFNHQPPSSYRSGSNSNSNNVSAGSRLMPSDYPESSSPTLSQSHVNNGGSGNNHQLHHLQQLERPPLYPITIQGGSRPAPLGPLRSWGSIQQDDGVKPNSPMMTSPITGRSSSGLSATATSPTWRYGSGGNSLSRANDMEYISDEKSEITSGVTGGLDIMDKRPNSGAISWSGSNSSGGRGSFSSGPDSQSSPQSHHNSSLGGPGLRKESSWSSFSSVGKGNNENHNGGNGGHSPVNLPIVAALAVSSGRHDVSDDMEMQESHHYSRVSQHLQQQQHQDGERQLSGSETSGNSNNHYGSISMMTNSPDIEPSESRFNNNTLGSAATSQMPSRQQQHFVPQQQQVHHREKVFGQSQQHFQSHYPSHHNSGGLHPLSPRNEYPPSSEMDGVYEHHQSHHHQQFHRYNASNSGITVGYHEEATMRSP
ncbi:hypothetical protein FBU30_002789 [Linnemannia zychae]|nr:hypothetical protein FBU30_002789 [Linnemannia zychae]